MTDDVIDAVIRDMERERLEAMSRSEREAEICDVFATDPEWGEAVLAEYNDAAAPADDISMEGRRWTMKAETHAKAAQFYARKAKDDPKAKALAEAHRWMARRMAQKEASKKA